MHPRVDSKTDQHSHSHSLELDVCPRGMRWEDICTHLSSLFSFCFQSLFWERGPPCPTFQLFQPLHLWETISTPAWKDGFTPGHRRRQMSHCNMFPVYSKTNSTSIDASVSVVPSSYVGGWKQPGGVWWQRVQCLASLWIWTCFIEVNCARKQAPFGHR